MVSLVWWVAPGIMCRSQPDSEVTSTSRWIQPAESAELADSVTDIQPDLISRISISGEVLTRRVRYGELGDTPNVKGKGKGHSMNVKVWGGRLYHFLGHII